MTKRAFGELEMAILQVLKPGERFTVKEVSHLLGDNDKYTTIMTVMSRMAQKKILDRERVGLHYEYWLRETIPTVLKKKLFGVKPLEVMAYLFDAAESVSDEDIQQMEDILKNIKKQRKK